MAKIAKRKLWLDANGRLVEDDDPRAVSLFCTPGYTVSDADAERVGLEAFEAELECRALEEPEPVEKLEGEQPAEPEPVEKIATDTDDKAIAPSRRARGARRKGR